MGVTQVTAYQHNSEMTLAVEGARGPPESEMTTLFDALYHAVNY
jgi:hypothetical protein